MIRRRLFRSKYFYTPLLIIILFIFSACSASPSQPAPQPTLGFDLSSDEVSPTLGFDLSKDGPQTPNLICPNESTLYNLYFLHLAILDQDYRAGETFYIRYRNIEPSFFQFWIEPSGLITAENIANTTDIGYHGTANHPTNDDCPVQTYDGIWVMHADIIGHCDDEEGKVYLKITEEWIKPVLKSSCEFVGGPPPPILSAPELDLVFDLNIFSPSDGVSVPSTLGFSAEYWYSLIPASLDLDPDDLELLPLVPEGK